MVCQYCFNQTRVTNSRHQKKANQTWRRRVCLNCSALFTTLETVQGTKSLAVRKHNGHLEPFWRDKLFVSVHDSLKHRKTAVSDASALTDTILIRLYPLAHRAIFETTVIAKTAHSVLERFDKAGATHYHAFHLQ